MSTTTAQIDPQLLDILETVSDPEIPVLSIIQMGFVRSAKFMNQLVEIEITPTYSGCPAMDVIADDIKSAFKSQGYQAVVKLILSPAWSTDWITAQGRLTLEKYGIAAPLEPIADKEALLGNKKLESWRRAEMMRSQLAAGLPQLTACQHIGNSLAIA